MSGESQETFDINYLTKLARLSLDEDEVRAFSGQLANILNYVERLSGVNVEGVEPMAHGTPLYNVLDADETVVPMAREGLLGNAPDSEDGQIKVPRVIEA
ncbi:MAG: Asp-tRNA(Asn)/Glu-tRNA(Gln) amidotransferase subunit GatC [Puniceicoccaceae bacterium]